MGAGMKGTDLLRLIAAQVGLHATMTGMRMAAPLLALSLGYDAAAVGLLVALFAVTQVFLALPAGRFADRHGLQLPLALSVATACAAGLAAALLPNLAVLCAVALLTGGASGAAQIALQRHVGRAARGSADLRRVFSWMAIAPAVANFVGPFAAGLLIDHAGTVAGDLRGFRIAFFVLALSPLAAWGLARRVADLPPPPPSADGARPRAWHLLREPMFRRLLFVNWLQSSSWDVHSFVLPILGHEKGLEASTIGAILGAFALAAAGIRVLLPLLATRSTERGVIATSLATTVVVFAAYPLLPNALAMGACSVLLGLALGAVQPMVLSLLHQLTPEARHGEALGLRSMAINSSSAVTPLLFGLVGTAAGVSAVFWLVGAVVALGGWRVRALELPAQAAPQVPGPAQRS